jgi:DNA polymerase III delta prime subunit
MANPGFGGALGLFRGKYVPNRDKNVLTTSHQSRLIHARRNLPQGAIAAPLPFTANYAPPPPKTLPPSPAPQRSPRKPPAPPSPRQPPSTPVLQRPQQVLPPPPPVSSDLWTECFRPRQSQDILGNVKAAKKLKEWVYMRMQDPTNRRIPLAVLLSGPPGTGKTTIAHNILRECGAGVEEVNASELRKKSAIMDKLQSVCRRKSLETLQPVGLVLDEIDGALSEEHGGAIAAVVEFIELYGTKACYISPIICICNDRSAREIRDLAKLTVDVRFYKLYPSVLEDIAKRICNATGKYVAKPMLDTMIHAAQGDARRLINLLYLAPKTVQELHMASSDVYADLFSGAKAIFQPRNPQNLKEQISYKTRLYNQDAEITDLLIFENYPESLKTIEDCVDMAALAGDVDVMKSEWEEDYWNVNDYSELLHVLYLQSPVPRTAVDHIQWSTFFDNRNKLQLKSQERVAVQQQQRIAASEWQFKIRDMTDEQRKEQYALMPPSSNVPDDFGPMNLNWSEVKTKEDG